MSMRKNWMFTYNNPVESPEDFTALLRDWPVKYAVFQLEIGENGTPHYQGYLEFETRKRLTTLRNKKQMHYEPRMGSQSQAREYCMKEDTRQDGPWEVGTFVPSSQGQRNDIITFRNAIQNGKRKRELIEEQPKMMARFPKFYSLVVSSVAPPSRPDLSVRLNYGEAGTGKTRYAFDNFPLERLYTVPLSNGTMWFDGYDDQNVVLLDDFAGAASKFTLANTLRILDIYPLQVPIKGGYVWFNPTQIIITSNLHPRQWFNWHGRENQYAALCRRIHGVFHYLNSPHGPRIDELPNAEFFDNYGNYFDEPLNRYIN